MLVRDAKRRSHRACKQFGRVLCFVDDRYQLPTRADHENPDPQELNKGHAAARTPAVVLSVLAWALVIAMIVAAYVMVQYVAVQSRRAMRVELPLTRQQLATLEAMKLHTKTMAHVEQGVVAPMFNLNAQLLVVGSPGSLFSSNGALAMANPVVVPDPENELRINANWPVCGGSGTRPVTHAKYVIVKYVDPITGQHHDQRYSDAQATFLMFAAEVFSGQLDTSCMRKNVPPML